MSKKLFILKNKRFIKCAKGEINILAENKYQNGGIIKWTPIRVDKGETLTLFIPSGKETYTSHKKVYKMLLWLFMIVPHYYA